MSEVSQMRRRVVITGIGLVTSLGQGVEEVWGKLLAGVSGIGLLDRFDTEAYPVKIAGQVRGFDPDPFIDPKDSRLMDLYMQFGVVASHLALRDAGLDPRTMASTERVGVIIGSGIGGGATFEAQVLEMKARGARRVHPACIPMVLINMAAAHVSMAFGIRGPTSAVSTACSSGANAIGDGLRMIQHGYADAMICGGAESTLYPFGVAGFWTARALSTRYDSPASASRPFDAERNGFVIAEGAAIVVLEALEHARARGARVYAELRGYGMSSDAYNMTMPRPDGSGAAQCMRAALADAGVTTDDVGYVNAHGTATKLGDVGETLALKDVFGPRALAVPVSSTKSMTGHLLGAAGSLEAAITALALRDDTMPPTINLEHPDPECDLDYVPGQARTGIRGVALTNSFAFGGHNVALVLDRAPADVEVHR
jgi:3-oxoacyl-[acyl-carrier-protein] synthase II